MKNEYPLFPTLRAEGEKEAVELINSFIDKLKKEANAAIDEMYIKTLPHIESDSWCNFRNDMMDGFKGYKNKIHAEYDFKAIRQKIYKDNKDEIIKDLNQDLVKEIADLKESIRISDEIHNLRR